MRRSRLLPLVVFVGSAAALGGAGGRGATLASDAAPAKEKAILAVKRTKAVTRFDRMLVRRIIEKRDTTWKWQLTMGRPLSPYAATAEDAGSRVYRRWVLKLWTKRAEKAATQARRPPHFQQWLCIHRHEGSWSDPNAPYYGGLQMNLGFQRTYGSHLLRRKGTADKWTPLEQMWVAERAHRSGRGFYPWPNTARFCGLI